jgi:hypothetical protein
MCSERDSYVAPGFKRLLSARHVRFNVWVQNASDKTANGPELVTPERLLLAG